MKKALSLILCISLLSSILVGCGIKEDGKKEVVDNKTEQTENINIEDENKESADKEETKDDEGEEVQIATDWETRKLEVPNMPDVKVEKVDFLIRDKITEMAETPFDYNINDFKDVLKKSEFINNLYVLGTSKRETIEGETYEKGDTLSYEIRDAIAGVLKDKYSEKTEYFNDILVFLEHSTYRYKNPSYVYFSLYVPELSANTQKELYKILEECIGGEYAEFLVYGETTEKEYNMKVETSVGEKLEYTFGRTIEDNGDKYRVTFEMYVSNLETDFSAYFDNGHISFYDNEFKYDIGTFIPELGTFSPTKFSSFAESYFKKIPLGYTRTSLDSAYYHIVNMEDGMNMYEFSIKAMMKCEDVSLLESPELKINYKIVEKDGVILFFECDINGQPGMVDGEKEAVAAYKELSEAQIEQIKSLFPNIDISGIDISTISETNNAFRTEGVVELFGNTYDADVSIDSGITIFDAYNGKWSISIE